MATIAEQLAGAAIQTSQQAPDLAGNFQKGAELAMHVENLQQQQQQIEIAKQHLKLAKVEKLTNAWEVGSKMPKGAAQKAFTNGYIPQMTNALGLSDDIHPVVQEMFAGDPALAAYMVSEIRAGRQNYSDLYDPVKAAKLSQTLSRFGDQNMLSRVVEDNAGDLNDAAKFAASEEGKSYRTKIMQEGQNTRQKENIDSTGKVAVAKDVAKEYADYQGAGGKAALDNSTKLLEGVIEKLKSGDVKTGTPSTKIPIVNSDMAQTVLNPEATNLKNDARSSILPLLRLTLGSAFTEKEGERVFETVWKGSATNAENARRVQNKLNELNQQRRDKEKLFKKEGFDVGSSSDFNIGGTMMSRDKALEFFKLHPQFEAQKKALGL